MGRRVDWSRKADISLKRIYKFIAKDSKVYATRFVKSLVIHTENILSEEDPMITGRMVPEFEGTPLAFLREIIYKGYRVIYDPTEDDKIYIVLVISGRMSVEKHI